MEPDLLVKAMSALASTLSIASSLRNLTKADASLTTDQALTELRKHASSSELAALSDPGIVAAAIQAQATVISLSLLEQLADEAQHCENEFIERRKQAATQTEKNQAASDAAQCMCSVLRDIKRFNNGSLPGGNDSIYDNWWRSYSCKD